MEKEQAKRALAALAEREKAEVRHKKWLQKRPWIGVEAQSMQPVTRDCVEHGEWVRLCERATLMAGLEGHACRASRPSHAYAARAAGPATSGPC